MREDVIKTLIERGYPEKQAISVASNLLNINNQLQGGLHLWLATGKETDYQVEGFKLSELKQKFDMTYPAAILTIDWLIKDPETAVKGINRGIR